MPRPMHWEKTFLLFILGLLAVATTGCGNILKPYVPRAPEGSYGRSPASVRPSTGGSPQGYACPDSPNVVPDYDYERDGTGQFSVCHNRDSQADILVHGSISQGTSICIFPAQVIDDQHIYVKPDVQTGLPWSQCVEVTDQGAYARFEGISWNAAFIVESIHKSQMQSCLFGGNYYGCPRYSFGRFR